MKKIAILDSSGMAGHVISDYLLSKNQYQILLFEEKEIISSDFVINPSFFRDEFDIIINPIRCLVEESNQNPQKAILYNSLFPHYLKNKYKSKKTKIIHLSTDCVFSGDKGNYNEEAEHDGFSIYSKTKSLGEVVDNKNIVLRTSYIGPSLKKDEELFDWFLQQEKYVSGFTRAYWNGVTTLELAKKIHDLIKLDYVGVYHLIGEKKISKFDLLVIMRDIWKKDIEVIKDKSMKIDRSLLDTKKILKTQSYKSMFLELYNYMTKDASKYSKYNLDL